MNRRIIQALVEKDIKLYFRDRFFALITVLSLVFYAAIYFIMPSDVNEKFSVALYAPNPPAFLTEFLESDALEYEAFDAEEEVYEAINKNDYMAGLIAPADLEAQIESGEHPAITLVLSADAPVERNEAITALFQTWGYSLGDTPLNIQINQTIIGEDRVGNQIPARDRMLPLFAIIILITETMGLANLIANEVETRTLRAILVSPTRMLDLFIAKGIVGVLLAFSQAAIVMFVTGGLAHQPLLILVALLLGAFFITSIGFLLAALANTFLEIVAWSVLVIIIFSLPAVSVLFPGTLSAWVEIIPIYPLVDTIHQVVNFDATWGDVWQNLVILLAIGVAMMAASVTALERKFR